MEKTFVWGLYEKHPGEFDKLVGIFSSPVLAKNCKIIQPCLTSDWQYREVYKGYLWLAYAIDRESYGDETFHFTAEEIQVDRLIESA